MVSHVDDRFLEEKHLPSAVLHFSKHKQGLHYCSVTVLTTQPVKFLKVYKAKVLIS